MADNEIKTKKSNSIRYLTKEGFRSIHINRLMTLASVTVLMSCLVIIGAAFLLFLNINAVLDGIESQNVVMVFVNDEASVDEIKAVETDLMKIENVSTCELVTRDDAFEIVLDSLGQDADMLEGVTSDFLPDGYKITLKDLSLFDATISEVKEIENVLSVRENSALAEKLTDIRNSITYICLGIIILLFIVSLFIIANTIRISMYSRRLEISIMKAVGATNSFIRWPFLIEGMTIGLISAVVGEVVLYVLYTTVKNSLASMIVLFNSEIVPFGKYALVLFIAFAVIGIFTGSVGSAVSMGRYLKEQGSVIANE
ncbi:MAG TPA: ABC transporter permease [Clostridiales bacterium]|nr:ABC transporter permease [Clostridiales bacterium]